ncbi:MAG: hypothetical protein IJ418_01705 [Clostridia bacterium]|nr:hypothetical protein [Clostridia bacterium]
MMKCTKEVQRECPYSRICGPDCEVADDSECAEFIMSVIIRREKEAEAREAEYLRQERQAIQEEVTP